MVQGPSAGAERIWAPHVPRKCRQVLDCGDEIFGVAALDRKPARTWLTGAFASAEAKAVTRTAQVPDPNTCAVAFSIQSARGHLGRSGSELVVRLRLLQNNQVPHRGHQTAIRCGLARNDAPPKSKAAAARMAARRYGILTASKQLA